MVSSRIFAQSVDWQQSLMSESRRAKSDRCAEKLRGKNVCFWRGQSASICDLQDITLSDGVTIKRCAIIMIHGKELFQALRFVGQGEITTLQ